MHPDFVWLTILAKEAHFVIKARVSVGLISVTTPQPLDTAWHLEHLTGGVPGGLDSLVVGQTTATLGVRGRLTDIRWIYLGEDIYCSFISWSVGKLNYAKMEVSECLVFVMIQFKIELEFAKIEACNSCCLRRFKFTKV